ncbi:FAD-binding protein [Pontibacter sp. G13]|uniref:FAD-binding protein n=1 Tax=Pontibacter sp. G13 TaxID=3074898 RepID=UPI00288C3363|nr:FAD-binding protein [Pontibacter sp. G13]WNJ20380.1 FAD-binding protein [Pontibacter sp. G13]
MNFVSQTASVSAMIHGNTAQSTRNNRRVQVTRNLTWSNRAQTVKCTPEQSFFPKHFEDLKAVVKMADRTEKNIRVVASGYAQSDLISTPDILLYLQHLDRVRVDQSQVDCPIVVAEAGATIGKINHAIESEGFALPSNVVMEDAQIGAVISSGSQGTGWSQGCMSDLVEWIELIDSTGTLRRFDRQSDSPEVMQAVSLHMGMMGITYRLALRIQPTWNVHVIDQRLPLEDTIAHLPVLVKSHESVQFWWKPFSEEIWMRSWNRTDRAVTSTDRHCVMMRTSARIRSQAQMMLAKAGNRMPKWSRKFSQWQFNCTMESSDRVVSILNAIHCRRACHCLQAGSIQFAFPLSEDFHEAQQAFEMVKTNIEAFSEQFGLPAHLNLHARFVGGSQATLSPTHGMEHACYLYLSGDHSDARWAELTAQIASEWLKISGATIHWASSFQHIPGIVPILREKLSKQIDAFLDIKEDLNLDPQGRFMSQHLASIFDQNIGPVGTSISR